jgi:hypothetical protein
MFKPSRIPSSLVLMGMTAALCSAQSVTSAHSGTLHYFDGDVSIDGTQIESRAGRFTEIKEQSVLRTGQGRAEVLLTPGVFLRIGENSAVRMLDNRLISTRVEVLSGSVMVESDDPQMTIKDSPVSLIYKDYEIRLIKHGLAEITSDPAQMKVYKGEAVVNTANDRATVKEGRELSFSAALVTEAFNEKAGDDLYLWTRDRSQSISAANMSSANSLNANSEYGYGNGFGSGYGLGNGLGLGSGYGYGSGYGSGVGAWNGGWYYNPYFDMYTFVPGAGTYFNAFGYGFFSPGTIYDYYSPSAYWYGGGGARGTGAIGRPLAGIVGTSSGVAAPLSSLQPRGPSGISVTPSPRGGVFSGGSSASAPSPGNSSSSSSSSSSSATGGFAGGSRASSGGFSGGHAGGGHR